MRTAAAVLDIARAELGTAENPTGSNRVKYNAWYYGRDVSGTAYPWCAVFVSWVADRAGAADLIPRHAYTPTGAAWFRQRGQFGATPRVGAIVFYANFGLGRISHVGIVETVHPDGSWTAIEGNTDGAGSRTGGCVMRQRRRSVGAGGGFGYPAYSTAPATAPTPTPAPTPAAGRPTLRRGATGEHVRALQQRLATSYPAYAGTHGRLVVDGDFGPTTDAWVREFQRRSRLTVDGVVGPATWKALRL